MPTPIEREVVGVDARPRRRARHGGHAWTRCTASAPKPVGSRSSSITSAGRRRSRRHRSSCRRCPRRLSSRAPSTRAPVSHAAAPARRAATHRRSRRRRSRGRPTASPCRRRACADRAPEQRRSTARVPVAAVVVACRRARAGIGHVGQAVALAHQRAPSAPAAAGPQGEAPTAMLASVSRVHERARRSADDAPGARRTPRSCGRGRSAVRVRGPPAAAGIGRAPAAPSAATRARASSSRAAVERARPRPPRRSRPRSRRAGRRCSRCRCRAGRSPRRARGPRPPGSRCSPLAPRHVEGVGDDDARRTRARRAAARRGSRGRERRGFVESSCGSRMCEVMIVCGARRDRRGERHAARARAALRASRSTTGSARCESVRRVAVPGKVLGARRDARRPAGPATHAAVCRATSSRVGAEAAHADHRVVVGFELMSTSGAKFRFTPDRAAVRTPTARGHRAR